MVVLASLGLDAEVALSDLSAWTGLVGVVVGVVMITGIDSWRTRLAKRKQTRQELLHAGGELADAADSLRRAQSAADGRESDPTWLEIIDARKRAMTAAKRTIDDAGVLILDYLAQQIVDADLNPVPRDDDEEARARNLSEKQTVLSHFYGEVWRHFPEPRWRRLGGVRELPVLGESERDERR